MVESSFRMRALCLLACQEKASGSRVDYNEFWGPTVGAAGSKDTLQIMFKKLGGTPEQLPVFVGGLERISGRLRIGLNVGGNGQCIAGANELAEERRVAEQTEAGKTVPSDTALPKMEVVLRKQAPAT